MIKSHLLYQLSYGVVKRTANIIFFSQNSTDEQAINAVAYSAAIGPGYRHKSAVDIPYISVELILNPLLRCGIFVSMVAGEQEKETRKNRGIKLCFINIRLNETES